MNKRIIQKIVVAGVVIKNNKVLIIQRNLNEEIFPNMWELPSGKREPLEESEISLLREIKEETGLHVRIVMPFSVFDYQIEKQSEIRDSTQINFLVIPMGNCKVQLSHEHQAFVWTTRDEIKKYNLTKKTKNVLKKAFELIDLLNI